MLNASVFSGLEPCIDNQGILDWGLNNERMFTLAFSDQSPSLNLAVYPVSVYSLLFYFISSGCVGMLSSSPTDDLFSMMVGLMQRRAPITWWGVGTCFDSCLSLRDSAQPSVLSWQLGSNKMSQLKQGGGRVISLQKSSLMRPDSGTEIADEVYYVLWNEKWKFKTCT